MVEFNIPTSIIETLQRTIILRYVMFIVKLRGNALYDIVDDDTFQLFTSEFKPNVANRLLFNKSFCNYMPRQHMKYDTLNIKMIMNRYFGCINCFLIELNFICIEFYRFLCVCQF